MFDSLCLLFENENNGEASGTSTSTGTIVETISGSRDQNLVVDPQ